MELSAYETKTNRKKLVKAIPINPCWQPPGSLRRIASLCFNRALGDYYCCIQALLPPKSTKDTIGVAVMTLKRGQKLLHVRDYREGEFAKPHATARKICPPRARF